jgi:hypothetical protein
LLHGQPLTSGYYPPSATAVHCAGNPVVSLGYNYSRATDCGFTATGDIQGVAWGTAGTGFQVSVLAPVPPDAPTVEAIPVGGPGCDGTNVDIDGTVRPHDSGGNGSNGCDIGAKEL